MLASNKYEVRAIYWTLVKLIKQSLPRKLEREAKLKEFRFILDEARDLTDPIEIEYWKKELYEIIMRIEDGTFPPYPRKLKFY